jgi:hypothetical protein
MAVWGAPARVEPGRDGTSVDDGRHQHTALPTACLSADRYTGTQWPAAQGSGCVAMSEKAGRQCHGAGRPPRTPSGPECRKGAHTDGL